MAEYDNGENLSDESLPSTVALDDRDTNTSTSSETNRDNQTCRDIRREFEDVIKDLDEKLECVRIVLNDLRDRPVYEVPVLSQSMEHDVGVIEELHYLLVRKVREFMGMDEG